MSALIAKSTWDHILKLFIVGELTLGLVAMDDVRRAVGERKSTGRDQFSPQITIIIIIIE